MYHGLDVGAVPPISLYKTQAEIDYENLLLVNATSAIAYSQAVHHIFNMDHAHFSNSKITTLQ